jgi:hypothetical protein
MPKPHDLNASGLHTVDQNIGHDRQHKLQGAWLLAWPPRPWYIRKQSTRALKSFVESYRGLRAEMIKGPENCVGAFLARERTP